MTVADLETADHVTITEAKKGFSKIMKNHRPTVITVNGQPEVVLVPWKTMIDLVESYERLNI